MTNNPTCHILAIGGYSNSSGTEKDQKIETVVQRMMDSEYHEGNTTSITYLDATNIECVREISLWVIDKISNSDDHKSLSLLIIGKSMGGAKLFYAMKYLMRKHFALMTYPAAITIFTIDPHGAPLASSQLVPFGKNRDIVLPLEWNSLQNLRWINVYQQNEYPYGANVVNADESIKIPDVNHFNIVNDQLTREQLELEFSLLLH